MRPTRLDITALADAILADSLGLSQHVEYAGAPWLEPCQQAIISICRDQPVITETESAMKPFADYFTRLSPGVSNDNAQQVVTLVTTAVNCGFFIAFTERDRSWARKPESPSPEAETLLAATSDALEREVQRKWNDSHTGKLRTVALMYGYLIGCRGVDQVCRTMSGTYREAWVFVPT